MKLIFTFFLALLCEKKSALAEPMPYWHWYSTPEEIDLTEGGVIPSFPCPLGHYRDLGDKWARRHGGLKDEGCIPCPRGRYGSSIHLTSPQCSGACPLGTYSDVPGIASESDCKPCPEGTFGDTKGQTSRECSGKCSDLNTPKAKYYGIGEGVTSQSECKVCPVGILDAHGQCENKDSFWRRYGSELEQEK